MSTSAEGRSLTVSWWPDEARSLFRWVSTNNPFYVVSAGLFLVGLWLSYGDPRQVEDTGMLMAGLTGYTVLLAGTAVLLIRYAKVWDDARTVLLLIVLMFLATSVTFDRVIVFDARFGRFQVPIRGFVCNFLGLALAIGVSEVLLVLVRLRLPWCYRVPFYLMLGLFFLYPLALTPFLKDPNPRNPGIMWGLFGFPSAAALIFLTLLPAIRLGRWALRDNGSPWHWPLYPWVLFGLLAFAVPCRAILLCYSMHLIDVADLYDMTFGPYFLVPFGLVKCVLLLEAGLVTRRRGLLGAALALPAALVGMALIGHRSEPIYQEFLREFTRQLGADPVYCTLLAVAGYYVYAAIRQVNGAIEALTATLAVLTFVPAEVLVVRNIAAPEPAPIIVAASILLGLGIWRRGSWRCFLALCGLAVGIALGIPHQTELFTFRWAIAFHLVLGSMLLIGALFDDDLGRALRVIGPGVALLACAGMMLLSIRPPVALPTWVLNFYPLFMALVLAAYGFWLWHPPTMIIAALLLTTWVGASGWQVYRTLRLLVPGMDYLVLSFLVFALAVLVSLGKSKLLRRSSKGPAADTVESAE